MSKKGNIKNVKKELPYLTGLIKKLAPKVGAKFVVEPEWRIAGQIIYPNGVVRSLRMYSLDLNYKASSSISQDKGFAKFFMEKRGYPVAEGITIFSDAWAKQMQSNRTISYAPKYVSKLGYPVIVKPNSRSQGVGVSLAENKKELMAALKEILKTDKVALIERYMPGLDYRIVVLDDEVISAYGRVALSVTGDGKSSILSLLKKKQKNFAISGRDTQINFDDPRIKLKLKKFKLNFSSIIPKGKKVYLLDNANLSTGGDSVDMTNTIHPSFKKIAINLTRDMGLRIAGVDIMVTNGDITQDAKNCQYFIIEINAAPGLDHYVTTGKPQRKIVEDMYLKVLIALGKKS